MLGWINPIGCKLIFKKKINMNGYISTYKVRFVAKSFTQRPKIDYDEMFSSVAMLKSVSIFLALAPYNDY